MTLLRRLAWATLILGYIQIVFGAVVRITGSGMGCGDNWPNCNNEWIPTLNRADVMIEFGHRIGALLVSLAILSLITLAWMRRREPGVAGAGGVLRPAIVAGIAVVITAIFGAITVKLELPPMVVVVHLVLAMTILGALTSAVARTGGFGVARARDAAAAAASDPMETSAELPIVATPRAWRSALVGAVIASLVILLGGLTANMPGAAFACRGFPFCSQQMVMEGGMAHVQLTHRVLAYLLALHIVGLVIGYVRRREPRPLRITAILLGATIVAQVVVAAMLVTAPPGAGVRSLHQALGTLIWVLFAVLVVVARRMRVVPAAESPSRPAEPPQPPSTPTAPKKPPTVAVYLARGAGH